MNKLYLFVALYCVRRLAYRACGNVRIHNKAWAALIQLKDCV